MRGRKISSSILVEAVPHDKSIGCGGGAATASAWPRGNFAFGAMLENIVGPGQIDKACPACAVRQNSGGGACGPGLIWT
jgi:hypothetical protein